MAQSQSRTRAAPRAKTPQTRPDSRDAFIWDTEVPQLAERRRGAARSWIVQTRAGGRSLRRKIGDVEEMPVEVARALAREALAEIAAEGGLGLSPAETIASFAPRFLEDCAGQWKPTTLASHRLCFTGQILPGLGEVCVAELTKTQVIQWRDGLTVAPGTRNRALAVLSSMMRHAELLGLRPSGANPCAGLRRHKSDFAADYLDPAGYAVLGGVLDRAADRFPLAVPFVRFVALTGCRRSEAMGATWDQLDLTRTGGRLALPDAKSGPKALWLGRPTRALLAGLPRHGRAIFAGEDPAALEAELRPLWRELRKALRRPRFRLHDLRHSAASVGINRGFSLQVIGGLLGHADLDSTAGYAHLDQGRMVAASERVGAHLSRAFARPRTGGAPPPRAARRKTLAAPAPEDYAAFAESGEGLHGFCAARKIDPRLFHAGLKDWQKSGRTTS